MLYVCPTRPLERRYDPGGAIMPPPPCFSSFGTTKSPKQNLGTFLVLKPTWKAILDNFRFLSLATRCWKQLMDFIEEKFKISKILSFYGAMLLKWKLRTCKIQIEFEKIDFVSKQFFFHFFLITAWCSRPPKILDVKFLKSKHKNWGPGTWQLLKGAKSQEVWFQ